MAKLGAGVDELEGDLLGEPLLGQCLQGLPEGKNSLLVPNAGALQHEEVLLDLSVVREATHGSDGLVSKVVIGCGVVLDELSVLHLVSFSNTVDLLVDLGTVVVALLTSPGNGVLDPAGMPGSNAGNLPETLVGLPGQLFGVPSACHTLESVTLSNTNHVDALVHGKDISHRHLLLEVLAGEVDLIGNTSTVQLDLHDVSLLLPAAKDLHLSVADDTDHGAVLLDLVQVLLDFLLAKVIGPLGAGLGEGLLLGGRPKLKP